MTDTLIEHVIGNVEECNIRYDYIRIVGWCFHKIKFRAPLRLNHDGNIILPNDDKKFTLQKRLDICQAYNNNYIGDCGWTIHIDAGAIDTLILEMKIDDEWRAVFDFLFYATKEKYIPSFVVVDDFYKFPDKIRQFALSQDFQEHPNNHKGKRTDKVFPFPNLKQRFERILGCRIKNWEEHSVNCCFQSCLGGDQLVYHFDIQEYAGLIYLTPDAPPEAGTTFYRSKITKRMKVHNDFETVFKTGVLDPSQFDIVDVVGNKYNRLVLFDAQMIHAASSYFGNHLHNGRLFQIFFFDLDRSV
jgi:hypothetical protein